MMQYALDMHLPVLYAPEQWIQSTSNSLAHAQVMSWPSWPLHAFYLVGEPGSGKTHLAHVWGLKTGAIFLPVDDASLPDKATVVEHVEDWKNEEALFHLYNHMMSARLPLLITSVRRPSALPFHLPDLGSRLRALPVAEILPPDDALLGAVLRKHFADRQLMVADEVIDYIVKRTPRSFTALARLVATLDADSLAQSRTLTIPFVRNYL